MAGRKSLPHTPPLWIDSAREIWFITICCTPRGKNQLAEADRGEAVLESVRYRWRLGHWYPHLFLLMPDHAHALLSFASDRPLQKTVSDWKHWTAAKLSVAWQVDFFDHRLRGEESFTQKAAYISANPVRAGLVSRADEWPYVWRAPGIFTGHPR